MSRSQLPALAMLVTCWVPAAFAQDQQPPAPAKSDLLVISAQARLDDIARATILAPRDIAQLDMRTGPQLEEKHKNVPNDVTIECYYKQDVLGGTTEKFKCEGAADPNDPKARLPVVVTDASGKLVDVKLNSVKVRYGSVKVFSDVIATRLAWALGFGGDIETPVTKVICHGCSLDPFKQKGAVNETHEFPRPGDRPQVSIEEKPAGTGIYVAGMRFARDDGEDSPAWRWDELGVISDSARRAQADALVLFAVFIKHSDSKALQNMLICPSDAGAAGVCPDPLLYVHDFGNTLGTTGGAFEVVGGIIGFLSNLLGIHTIHPLDLREWRDAKVWKDERKCVGSLQMDGGDGPGLINPPVSEGGRRLLADRLTLLINARNSDGSSKLRDIFDAAHIEKYDDHGAHFTADDWVTVFTARARQITEKKEPCPW